VISRSVCRPASAKSRFNDFHEYETAGGTGERQKHPRVTKRYEASALWLSGRWRGLINADKIFGTIKEEEQEEISRFRSRYLHAPFIHARARA